jgi:SAM-dependent methyltransferase
MKPASLFSKDYEGVDYERFWSGSGKRYLDRLEQKILNDVLPGGSSIVEIGAGFGRLGQCYVDKYTAVHMVEPASNLRASAMKAFGDKVVYHAASVYDLPLADQSFDTVLMVRVFHHLRDSNKALKELHRILRPGGTLIFSYSNLRNVGRGMRFLLGKVPNPWAAPKQEYEPELFGHSPAFIADLLRETGFVLKEQYATCILNRLIDIFPVLERLDPPLSLERMLGALEIAPANFVVAQRQ